MGYDAQNTLGTGSREEDVAEFLVLLGFGREQVPRVNGGKSRVFWHYDPRDYERFQGLSATVYREQGQLLVHTRTLISRNKADCDLHNATMKQLRKRFGGFFVSDYGRNRYFPWEGEERSGADAGCYLAYWRFKNNCARIGIYQLNRSFKDSGYMPPGMEDLDPAIISNNLLVPLLVSLFEDFLRSCYVALLRFSSSRSSVLRGWKIDAESLLDSEGGQLLVEEAVARGTSFQSLDRAQLAFNKLDKKLDLLGQLKRPYRRRKNTLQASLEELIRNRHGLVHRAEIDRSLTEPRLDRAIGDVTVAVKRFYEHLIAVNGWPANDQG